MWLLRHYVLWYVLRDQRLKVPVPLLDAVLDLVTVQIQMRVPHSQANIELNRVGHLHACLAGMREYDWWELGRALPLWQYVSVFVAVSVKVALKAQGEAGPKVSLETHKLWVPSYFLGKGTSFRNKCRLSKHVSYEQVLRETAKDINTVGLLVSGNSLWRSGTLKPSSKALFTKP
jgi:hypothetical protein